MDIRRRDLLGAGAAIGLGMATKTMLGREPAVAGFDTVAQPAPEPSTNPEAAKLALQFKSGAFKGGNGISLPYRYFEPASKLAGDSRMPVILYLHGEDEAGTDNKAQLTTTDCATVWTTPEHLAQHPVYVVAPQLPKGKDWTSEAVYSSTLALLDQFMKSHPQADTNRIYLVGFSMGATGLWSMLLKNPKLFASAMPISGSADKYLADYEAWAALKNTPVFIIHSYDDRVVPITGALNAIAAYYTGGNNTYGPTPCLWGQGSTPSPHNAWWTALRKFEVVYNSLFIGDLARTKNGEIDPTTLYTHRNLGNGITQVWDYGLDTSWVIERPDKAVIVDVTEGRGNIYQYIRDNVLVNKDVGIEIFLTHDHNDHILDIASFVGSSQLKKAYVHEADSLPVIKLLGPDAGKVQFVKDGDLVPLGGKNVEVISVPGHTLGSIVMKYENYLFSGDSIGTGYCGVSVYPIELYVQSVEHLLAKMGNGKWTVYAGHTGECTGPMTEKYVLNIFASAKAILNNTLPGPPYWRAGEASTRRVTPVSDAAITYPIDYIRKIDGALSALEINPGTLRGVHGTALPNNAGFAPYTSYYTASVREDVDSISIKPTVLEADHKGLTVNGSAVSSGKPYRASLKAGNNRFAITVTAASNATRIYTLDVMREAQKG